MKKKGEIEAGADQRSPQSGAPQEYPDWAEARGNITGTRSLSLAPLCNLIRNSPRFGKNTSGRGPVYQQLEFHRPKLSANNDWTDKALFSLCESGYPYIKIPIMEFS